MNKKTLIIILIVIIAAGSGLIYFSRAGILSKNQSAADGSTADNEQIEAGTQPGQKAPDFTLNTISDKKASLSDFYGQKVFLNFWATWCPPCRKEMPAMQKLKDNNKIKIVTVNIGEDKGKALNYLLENNLNFSVLLDKDEKTAHRYNIRGIPTTFILDENGIIEKRHSGGLTYEQMISLIE